MYGRMNSERLQIGIYCLAAYARTDEHIRDAAESGLDFFVDVPYDRAMLDKFQKYGLGALVTGVCHIDFASRDPEGKSRDIYKMEIYRKSVESFADHPAIWGIDLGDEPSAMLYPFIGQVVDYVRDHFPHQFPSLNLLPTYADPAESPEQIPESQLGAMSYKDYIDQYCRYVPCQHICYDHYPYNADYKKSKTDYSERINEYYENLRIVEDACRSTGRRHWLVVQVNTKFPDVYDISLNRMRFQAFSGMAFGVETIIWACYTAGWWQQNILDKDGNKTAQYDKMKQVNKEIHTIGEEYMKYRNVATHFVGFEGHPDIRNVNAEPVESLDTGVFMGVRMDNGSPLLVGQMVSRRDEDGYALMICAADDTHDIDNTSGYVTFRCRSRSVMAYGGNGKINVIRNEDGSYAIPIHSCEGILITAR
ncbi:MAG: hypothetical protein E7658_08475 [Ruminococcaceae bacterium]|nr:hypothetical protein [Oscillospiraceae bacterium]